MPNEILGKGFDFPIQYERGKWATAEGVHSVKAGIFYLLSTRIGERFFRPEFGSLLHTLVFEPLDNTTIQLAEVYAEDAIRNWIPRVQYVKAKGVISREQENRLDLYIECRVINRPVPEEFVYPFYVQGGIQ